MAEVSEAEARARRLPAYALLRAAAAQDADTATLLVRQAQEAGTLDLLAFNMAHIAARAMLAAEGWDVQKVLRVLDGWMDVAAHGVVGPDGRRETNGQGGEAA